ncbi:SIR2 family protein [Pseudarthrobacter sp. B4EP4b]|uniref:SIR2 family protein n=1 Tax=Pseudarthrobacter sp. B4EP4b TaxID=2590664 RepID=UPI001150D596|nr:SIR2 family protein [Pseudarthrobacter sp. B4EP4b]
MTNSDHALPGGKRSADVDECAVCSLNYDFMLPPQLVEAAKQGRLVIFAGAGISTENSRVFPSTFYDEIRSELPEDSVCEDFPSVMSAYEKLYGRLQLVEEAMKRIRYAETFPAVRQFATMFHEELSTIAQVREIITTNWDAFFEEICGAIPIVVDGDYAFYNLPDRKVYKIHGSLRNISTLVATSEDYEEAEASLRASAVGGTLRHLLATKTIVFTGYSLRDADFRNVYEPLMEGMGKLRPISYFVGPFDSPEAEALGIRHIKTDGTYFLRSLKRHLEESGDLLSDEVLDRSRKLRPLLATVHKETMRMDWRSHPELFFSLAYQDGMLDGFDRIQSQCMTGEYTDPKQVRSTLRTYNHLLHVAVDRNRFWDAAYINGYLNGLMTLVVEDKDLASLPFYELFEDDVYALTDDEQDAAQAGLEQNTEGKLDTGEEPDLREEVVKTSAPSIPQHWGETELVEALEGLFEALPEALKEVERYMVRLGPDMVPQHTPFLDGVMD